MAALAYFTLPSLVDPVSLNSMNDPIRFEPCHHIVDITTAAHFPIDTGICPLCRSPIHKKVHDVAVARIIMLLTEINKYPRGSKEQISLSYDLGRCLLSPFISSNKPFDKPVKLMPCGHVIEESLAEKLAICPVLFCNKGIESKYKEFNLKSLVEDVRRVIHEIGFESRVTKKEVVASHFDNDVILMELADGILARGGSIEQLTIQDYSDVTDAGFISFVERFASTLKAIRITFSPKGLSKAIFAILQGLPLESLDLIGSYSILDADVISSISKMRLKSLNLQGCRLTRKCLSDLKKMTTLKSLALDKSPFTTSELAELQEALPGTKFYFPWEKA